MDQGQQQRTVGAGFDGYPLVGNGRVAGAHGVDGHKTPPIALELGQCRLHRVGVVVLGRAYHHEQLGAFQIRAAELPERAADGVDHPGGHIDRAKATVRGVVGRAKLPGKQTCQCLHLVTSGKQGKLLGVGGADLLQAIHHHRESCFPFDFHELAFSAFTARFAQQGLVSRAGEYCFMMPEEPLAQITPWLSG